MSKINISGEERTDRSALGCGVEKYVRLIGFCADCCEPIYTGEKLIERDGRLICGRCEAQEKEGSDSY